MTLLDSSQPAPDQSAPAALPDAHALFPDIEEHHEVAAGAGAHLPDANDLFPDMPQPERRPITGAVAPGPVGDWIFGNTQHSSLARIMDAFGATVDQDIGHYGEKLGLSEETSKALRDKGIFNDYAQGQHNIGKALNETLLRSGAVLVNGAIYGMPAVWHGLQEAVMEAGEQAQGTEIGKAINAKGLARSVAAVPEAFPDFNFRMGMPHAPVPEPLRAARDLNVIGPGGEAAWKGVGPEVSHETGGPTVPVEAAAAEALPSTPAAAPDVHAIARSIAPEIFTEFDALEKRRDLFRKWIDDGGAQVPPNIAQNLKETEARLRELEPAVTAAYTKAKEGLPAITEAENVGGTEAANPSAGGSPEAQAAAAPASTPEEGAVPAEGAPPPRVAGEAGAEAAPRSIEDQRDHIVNEVKQSLIDAGRPSEEAQAAAQLVAARYEARAARFKGALGTPQDLFDRESSDIRKMERVAKSTKRLVNPNSARALDDFQERMAQAKELRRKATEAGGGAVRVMSAEERFAGVTEGEWKAQLEDSIEALEPEERQSVREDLSHLPAEDLQYLAERAEAGLPLFQIEAYHGSPHHFERFDISKIGTGEGAQAYGHGLYFAENEGVAKQYRSALSKGAVDWDDPHAIAAHFVDAANGNRDDAIFQSKTHVGIKNFDALKKAQDIIESGAPVGESRAGALYRVSLKPDKEDLLDWDKPLSEQSPKIQKAMAPVLKEFGLDEENPDYLAGTHVLNRMAERLAGGASSSPKVTARLREAGIPGIKYADAGSRIDPVKAERNLEIIRKRGQQAHETAEEYAQNLADVQKDYDETRKQTHNFVIFDDKDVEITHRNGEALSKQERADAVRELYQRPELKQNEHELVSPAIKPQEISNMEEPQDGRPVIIKALHGSEAENIDEFDAGRRGSNFGDNASQEGFFFTENKKLAGHYGAHVHERYIALNNPKVIKVEEILRDDYAIAEKRREFAGTFEEYISDFMEGNPYAYYERGMLDTDIGDAKKAGHDGLILDFGGVKDSDYGRLGRAVVAFDAAQISKEPKSVPPTSDMLARDVGGGMDTMGRLNQKALGSFQVIEGERPILKLAKSANASTFIHESGHEWLEQLMRDDVHPLAPADLKADAKTVRDWLGIKNHQDLNTGWPGERGQKARAAHEKFARGFEQYLRLGIAPSPQLASVFAKFKAWMTRIYQTLKGLGEPINEDIRGVFDRMLAAEPQRVVAGAEREEAPSFHNRAASLAESTDPAKAADVADEIQSERDFIANDTMLNEHDARLENTQSGAGRRPTGIPEPAGYADETGANSGKARAAAEAGDIVPGGSEAAPASHRTPPQPQPTVKTEPPSTGNAPFAPSAGKYTDKIGNFRIDGLNDPNQIFDALRENIEKTGGMVEQFRRGVTDGDLLNISLASGLKPEWLDSKKIGDAYSHREIKALEELFIAASAAVKDTVLAAATGEPTAILAQAEAMARMEMVQAHLAGASAEAGRALGAVRRVMKKAWGDGGRRTAAEAAASLDRVRQLSAQKWESPEALSAALKAETGRTLFQLQEMAEFAGKLETPGRIARFVEDTSNGKMKQAVVFYYVNALLSGPVTHLRYAIGNAVTALYSPIRTTVAAGVDFGAYHAGLQNERRIFLGEAGTELYALGRGFTEGMAAGKEGWRIGTTPDLPGEGAPGLFGAQPIINPIPGKIGYAIGIPGKGVGAVHGFGAAMRYRQELNRLAYRTAMQEKLQGDAFTSRLADLSDRPPPENMEAAAKVARSDLYMAPTDYNSISAGLARISDSSIIAKIILPFVKIGMQVESKAIANSPLALGAIIPGAKSLAPHIGNEIRADLSGVNGPEARNMRIGSMIGGTGLMAFTAGLVANGDMTGHGPHDKQKRDVWLALHKPYTVSLGPLTLNYQGWGYLGKLMAISANAYETHQGWGDEEGHSIATAYFQGFHEALFDDSFLRGVKDFVDAINDWDRYGARWASNMLLNWMPASVGMGQVSRLVDPYQRETHTSSDTILDTIFKEAWNKVPLASQGLYPKRDVFGQPIPSGSVIGGALTGLPIPNYSNDRTVKMLDSLHIGISNLHDQIRGVKLTDKQFDDYKVIAGVTTKMRLDSMMQTTGQHLASTGRPEDRAKLIEIVHKIVTHSRNEAANAVMMHAYHSDNDILTKAKDAKAIKKGLVAPPVH